MPVSVTSFPFAVERGFTWVARRKWFAIVLVGLLSLASRGLLLPVLPIPQPAVQDEFSYLLASDTFASGRLANPTPAFSEHFESPHVLMHPTYSSQYPPLAGVVMAAGQKFFGEPWIGVWLSSGLLCSAICWALQGWLPASWALLGATLALVRIGIVSCWSEGYWGGALAGVGGALVIGAVPRLIRRQRPGTAAAYGLGIAILANTRPYEGLVLVIACTGYLAVGFVRRKMEIEGLIKRVAVPMILVLAPVFLWLGYYNYRVTGSPLELPYVAHDRQYATWSTLLWQTHASPEPVYSSQSLKAFWIRDSQEKLKWRENLVAGHVADLVDLGRFFLGWPMILCMLALAYPMRRDPTARAVVLLLALFYAGIAFDARMYLHYAAPGAACAYILAASTFRGLRRVWPGGVAERMYLPWCLFALFTVTSLAGMMGSRYWFGPIDFHIRAKRATADKQLEREPGNHLVLVRYGPQHDLYEELVYNLADIDRPKVIWARSLGPEKDSQLLRHYQGRRVWLAEENGQLTLRPYRGTDAPPSVMTQLAPDRGGPGE